MNGPLSLILTTTERPFLLTLTNVPKGSARCAAVKALGLNFSPFAVIFRLLHCPGVEQSYQDATSAPAGVARERKASVTTFLNSFFSVV
jgi:hypothetical protein